ncbi:hypothetical protein QJS10_CPB17g00289 [Acorus calamus]|uniref:UBZ4-type domain-containing protein n=1 Tax=Acorus calamus TaxID=4465 RepID=A0AAV9CYW4_ACOCL|nr:hypothetical protein QJS10_CPB17g00289 [Acorus calamus]
MLSLEAPPDHSCSLNLSGLKTDERAQEGLASKRDKGEHHHNCFSIRDYVFTSRGKNIMTNWPFSDNSLQTCLNHGVHDLLPPFEPPDQLRSRVCRSVIRSDFIQDQSLLELVDPSGSPVSEGKSNTKHKAKNLCKSAKSSPSTEGAPKAFHKKSILEASGNPETATTPALSTKTEKKCRLIVKLNTVSDYRRTEDITSNSSAITDTMASKVCPVCKTFSSTSNTTLNAHIDQCLAESSNAKEVAAKPVKYKVKPRKTRLMADIIATAPCCTLEYLDRRNGSNWALDPTLVAPSNVVCTENKRPEDIDEDVAEGAVYVDANGTKIRILSELNDAPIATVKEDLKQRKNTKAIKEGKSNSVGRKKHFSKKYFKYLNVRPHGKKPRSFKPHRSEVHKTTEINTHSNVNEGEGSTSQILSSYDPIKTSEPGPLKKWGCSKRTDILKKPRTKDANRCLRHLGPVAQNQTGEGVRQNSVNFSVVRSHICEFPSSSEVFTSSPRNKSLSNTSQKMNSGEKSVDLTKNIIKPKLTKGLGDCASSPSKGMEIQAGGPPDKHKLLRNNHDLIPRAERISNLTKNISFVRPPSQEKNSISKKFRKVRSSVESSKRSREFSLDANDEEGSAKARHLEKFDSLEEGNTVEKISSGRSKTLAPKQGEENRFASEKKSTDMGNIGSGNDCSGHELVAVDSQIEDPNDDGRSVFRSCEIVEDHPSSSDVLLGHMRSICGAQAERDPLGQRPSDGDRNHEIIVQENQSALEHINDGVHHGVIDDPKQFGVSLASPTADAPQENSSITSTDHLSAQDQPMQIDGEPSGSSFSATSTVSPTSTPRSEFRKSGPDKSFGRHILVQDKLSLSILNSTSLSKMDNEVPREDVPAIVPAHQPCCCSKKEETRPRIPQILRKNTFSDGSMNVSSPLVARHVVGMEGLFVTVPGLPKDDSPLVVSADAALKFPASNDICLASPSFRAQTLRLMGKNLTVATKDGEDEMMNLPNAPPSLAASSSLMNTKYLSLLGFPTSNASLNQSANDFHGANISLNSNLHQNMWGGGSSSPAYEYTHRRSMHKKPGSAFSYNMERATSEDAVPEREVIVIDDSSDPEPPRGNMMSQVGISPQVKAFSCLPSQNMFLPEEQSRGTKPMSNNIVRWGNNSEGSRAIPSRPFIFSSPSQYYSPTLR